MGVTGRHRFAGFTELHGVARVAAFVGVALLVRGARMDAQPPARGRVVTDTVWSQALGASKALVVYLPPSYATDRSRRYPVAYYLHGAGGDETNWTRRARLDVVMDSLVAGGMPEMIVAMPDGDSYSFYTTYNVLLDAAGCRRLMLTENGSAERDCVAWPHYDDYVAYDIVRHMDATYRTLASRDRRAIAGLSMGGYGAITLALRYPATFAAAASHSGVLAPLEFAPQSFGRRPFARADSAGFATAAARFAPIFRVVFGADSAAWYARDPTTLAFRLAEAGGRLPALFVDCGTEDTYLPESRAFRDALASRGVTVTYHEWPGAHTWDYWRAHVGESLSWIASRIAPSPGR